MEIMGQYYRPCVLKHDKKDVIASINSWDTNNGAKLMEHSYLHNNMVMIVEGLLDADTPTSLAGHPFVWCGDYADEVEGTEELQTESDGVTPLKDQNGNPVYSGKNYYTMGSELEAKLGEEGWKERLAKYQEKAVHRRFIINKDKKLFVDCDKLKADKWGYIIHPLPLLTCNSNGRGGGDYYSKADIDLVGSWACDVVVVSDTMPTDYKELETHFTEDED